MSNGRHTTQANEAFLEARERTMRAMSPAATPPTVAAISAIGLNITMQIRPSHRKIPAPARPARTGIQGHRNQLQIGWTRRRSIAKTVEKAHGERGEEDKSSGHGVKHAALPTKTEAQSSTIKQPHGRAKRPVACLLRISPPPCAPMYRKQPPNRDLIHFSRFEGTDWAEGEAEKYWVWQKSPSERLTSSVFYDTLALNARCPLRSGGRLWPKLVR